VSTPLEKKIARKVQIGHEWVNVSIEPNGELSPVLTFRPLHARTGYSISLAWVYHQAAMKAAETLREERKSKRRTKRGGLL
jgi:hypothetical protein